jgi:hypothetical protein
MKELVITTCFIKGCCSGLGDAMSNQIELNKQLQEVEVKMDDFCALMEGNFDVFYNLGGCKMDLQTQIESKETKEIDTQIKFDNLVKLSEDTTYQFNRYASEKINEEPSKDDPHEDPANPLFWMPRELNDNHVVRRQLCIDMINIRSYERIALPSPPTRSTVERPAMVPPRFILRGLRLKLNIG